MAGKPSGAAPPHPRPGGRRWHRLGLGLLGSSGSDTAPSTPPLPPPAGFGDRGRLEFQSVSRQGRCREGANPEAKKGVARPVGAAGFRGLCGARSFPGSESPQVASGRGGGVTAVTPPPLRENAVSRALHQPRGGGSRGRPVLSAAAGLRPAGKPRSPSGGWRARVWGRPVPPPPPARGDPANPGRSRVT